MDSIWEGDHPRSIWMKFGFIPSSGSEEDFQFFLTMADILDVGQGHWTLFWKRTIQAVSHQSLVLEKKTKI